jgi:hypothetical protein
MSEGRDLVKEALQDAKSLREAAVESAKKELVEQMTPALRKLLDENIKSSLGEKRGVRFMNGKNQDQSQRTDYDGVDKFEESAEVTSEDLTLEDALQEFTEEKEQMAEKEETKKDEKEETKKEGLGEEIEISEAELRKVYEAALQTEVQVKKGFSDIVGGGELDQASKETGILDKGGDKPWENQDPPAKKNWIPENVRHLITQGMNENKQLKENLKKAVALIEQLGKKLHEVNLFNNKVMHVNKVLNSGVRLTKEQKNFVMESIDKCTSIKEVKMVYETIVGGFKTAAALNESRNVRPPVASAQRARTTGTPDQKVLSESVDKAAGTDPYGRLRQLAGLVNGKK